MYFDLPRTQDDAVKFHYFVIDNSLILALLEETFSTSALSSSSDGSSCEVGPSPSPLPTLTAILRSPTGRHVWSMQLRHNPRSEEVSEGERERGRGGERERERERDGL